jgi:uncharacterized protein (TIGR02147 family)
MSIFNYVDHRKYLRDHLASSPKKGHGLLSQWSHRLKVSTTLMSQIVSGKKSLNLEIAIGLAQIISLTTKETDYLLLLVEFDRAGNPDLRKHFKDKIEEAQAAARMLKNRIEDVETLTDEIKAHYYATWIYSAVRNLVSIDAQMSIGEIATRLKVSREAVVEATDFLQRHGLIENDKSGWRIGTRSIYLTSDSPLVNKHHQNWRLKSLQTMDNKNQEDLFFTSPMSLSKSVAREIRKKIVDLIQEVRKDSAPSDSETVRCLNIDWFEF